MPIIVADKSGDLTFFDSVKAAEGYLEPIDIRAEEYEAFDARGRRLELKIGERIMQRLPKFLGGNWAVEITRIFPSEKAPAPDELENLLREAFARLGVASPPDAKLPALIALAVDHWGYTAEETSP